MKKIALLLVFIVSLSLWAMSDTANTEPVVKENSQKLTQEELHNIAVNYYHYMFEEEHEWKGIRVDSSQSVIKDIFPYVEDGITLFYTVNFNPEGRIYTPAYKFVSRPIFKRGSGTAKKIKSIDDKKAMPFAAMRGFHSIREKTLQGLQGKCEQTEKQKKMWEKFNKPPNQFHERVNHGLDFRPPKWWLEKKNFKSNKNTEGMIQTEWNQYFPFNNDCPSHSTGKTLVGCTPLAMSQLMKYYEYPETGLSYNSYAWFNGEIIRTLEADFGLTTYDWANMPAYADSSSSQTEQDALSTLCKHAGIALNADYGVALGTAAWADDIPHNITKYFNYTSQLMSEVAWYPNGLADWKDSLITAMQNGKPVLYSAFWNSDDPGSHTWIVDDYKISTDEFHFNMGWYHPDSLDWNDWYPADDYLKDQDKGIFNIIPDRSTNALPIPYTETFENTYTSTTVASSQIPKYIGIEENNYSTLPDVGYQNSNVLARFYVPDSEDSFIIKKINLTTDSVPILRYKYRINDYQNIVEGDSLIIEVSKDNRLSWKKISKIDHLNYNNTSYYEDKIVSLNNFKNEIVNIRYHFYSVDNANAYDYYIDDIKVGALGLHFTDISYDDILQPKDAQSIKITPSITPPKSKGFEDYDMAMDFYVKEDSTAMDYILMYSDELLENGVFEYLDWDTMDLMGKKYLIKAVARTKSNNTSLDSTETRVQFSGRKCYVTYPVSYQDSTTFFDVELPLTIEGYIEAELSFRDTLESGIVLVGGWIYDFQKKLWTYEDEYADSNYFCDPENYIYALSKEERDKAVFEYKGADLDYIPEHRYSKNNLKRILQAQSGTVKDINPSVISKSPKEHFQYNPLSDLQSLSKYYSKIEDESKFDSRDMVHFDTIYYEHATSLNLFPGFYGFEGGAYYSENLWEPIAERDYPMILIPNWKLKLKEDPWYPYAIPHNSLREYAQNDDVYIEIWRPFNEPNGYNIVYINIARDSDNTEVASFQIDYNTKGKRYVEWATDGTTQPGFYTITAHEQFEGTSVIVYQSETIQICPLYEHWEHSGTWSDIWEINADSDYFKMYNFIAGHPGIGNYSLGAAYDTETGESIDESLSSDVVSFNLQHDAVFEVFMGLPYDSGFEDMYADYKVLLSKDGGTSWTAIASADKDFYSSLGFSATPGYKFYNWFTTIKNTASEENMIVKFVSQNQIAPQDTISQQICFDEIQIRYRTEPVPDGGQNFAGITDGSKVDLSWDAPVSKGLPLNSYLIYRNGLPLFQTTSTTHTDYSIIEDTMYNYSIVAFYEDATTGATDFSSMLDCSVDIFVSSMTTPANVTIAENATNVTITWDAVTGASSYKVYSSSDPYGTFSENTSGSFNGEQWVAPLTESKLFYYVVATDVSKENKKITKEREYRVK
ncbi:MAG: C10 family peptidase [Candidatus Delongbacteria bacterium]|nr:C10 family peptidase [Candidatus Delongbacteria bacterium]